MFTLGTLCEQTDAQKRDRQVLEYITDIATETDRDKGGIGTTDTFRNLDPWTHYNLSVLFIGTLRTHARTRKIKPQHVTAAANLLYQLDYEAKTRDMIDGQSALLAKVCAAAAYPEADWKKMPRDKRITHLNRIADVTDYIMAQNDIPLPPAKPGENLVRDEKTLRPSQRHRPDYLTPIAYYTGQKNLITFSYARNRDVTNDQDDVYEFLTHEMAHRLDRYHNVTRVRYQKRTPPHDLPDFKARKISRQMLNFFKDNAQQIAGGKKKQKTALRRLYYATVTERTAYRGNDIFRRVYPLSDTDDMLEIRHRLRDCPDRLGWLVNAIDGKIDARHHADTANSRVSPLTLN